MRETYRDCLRIVSMYSFIFSDTKTDRNRVWRAYNQVLGRGERYQLFKNIRRVTERCHLHDDVWSVILITAVTLYLSKSGEKNWFGWRFLHRCVVEEVSVYSRHDLPDDLPPRHFRLAIFTLAREARYLHSRLIFSRFRVDGVLKVER